MTRTGQEPIGTLNNPEGAEQWLRFGLPVAKGLCGDPANLRLRTEGNATLATDFRVLSNWHDGSVQWVLADTVTGASGPVYLHVADNPGVASKNPVEKNAAEEASTGDAVEQRVSDEGRARLMDGIQADLIVTLAGAARRLSLVRRFRDDNGICREYGGVFGVEGFPDLQLLLRVTQAPASGQCELKVQVHNLAASVHPNGCWDLGDPNSIFIDDLSLRISTEQGISPALSLIDQAQEPHTTRSFTDGQLWQYGSGGQHWDSPVHLDRTGRSGVREQGYKLFDQQENLIESGLRACPQILFEGCDSTRRLVPHHFWENFPAALKMEKNQVTWHLFPEETELQPGEAKTWLCDLGVPEIRATFSYNPAYVDQTGAILGCKVSFENELSKLLDDNLSGPGSFFLKREACDEYGWRNFGEIYADHEAMNAKGEDIFVSHYNNQYDPVWGLSLRFLSSGENAWEELATDLARHVVDIDIYKTDRDKAEYNNGLFWHTDHYLPALTATHRTYSRDHNYAYEGHQGGGGPGGQHCYPSGLALRYLMSGDEDFRRAATGLGDWIRSFYNGAPTVLARLHRLLTVDLRAGQMTNVGFIEKGYKYPLDRGTGNYLNTLIDNYMITQDSRLLDEMHYVISETVSPQDDPSKRKLAEVEEHWFYIVLLQSLARYLLLKEQLDQPDQHYAYARHTLIRYTGWILENEKPYLSNPEALEFPTDTWAAQDLRKANVLYYGAYFNPAEGESLRQKADEFWNYCVNVLCSSPERHTTRVQAIVMQNLGVREWCLEKKSSPYPVPELRLLPVRNGGTGRRFLRDLAAALRTFSFAHEIDWLKGRLGGR